MDPGAAVPGTEIAREMKASAVALTTKPWIFKVDLPDILSPKETPAPSDLTDILYVTDSLSVCQFDALPGDSCRRFWGRLGRTFRVEDVPAFATPERTQIPLAEKVREPRSSRRWFFGYETQHRLHYVSHFFRNPQLDDYFVANL
jgi:hypothetical protein